jgi:hypothetical protein
LFERCVWRQLHSGHDHAGRADTALRRAVLDECVLQAVAFFQSFNGRNLGVFRLRNRHQTRYHCLAVDQHGARATLPFAAALLRARESKVLAQNVEESLHRVRRDVLLLSVDAQTNRAAALSHAAPDFRAAPGSR